MDACLTKAGQVEGEDEDKLLNGLKKRTKRERPRPSDIPFCMNEPTVNVHGNLQNELLSLKMKTDLNELTLGFTVATECLLLREIQ